MKIFLTFLLVLIVSTNDMFSCTDVRLNNSGEYQITGRTMDFAMELGTSVVIVPRGINFISYSDKQERGISWTNKYAFVGTNALGQLHFTDGLNECGLSCATLWLTDSKFSDIDVKGENFIAIIDIVSWALGNFQNVDEVQIALRQIPVIAYFNESTKMDFPLHLSVHDKNGNDLVVEWLEGKAVFYNNQAKVLTNHPIFSWHLLNLENYSNLTNKNVKDATFKTLPNGTGMRGLPADAMPSSRFIRAYFKNKYSPTPKNTKEAIGLMANIMNNVLVNKGEVDEGDYTQWIVIRDHKELVYYFRDYDNTSLRAVDLKSFDFNKYKIVKYIPITEGKWYQNLDNELREIK